MKVSVRYRSVFTVLAVLLVIPGYALLRPQVGNIDASVAIERVMIGQGGRLHAWDQRGVTVPGWPIDLSAQQRHFVHGPRLLDLDYDQQFEVLAVSANDAGAALQLHVYRGDASAIASWHWAIPTDALVDVPLVADINHDSNLEIITSASDGAVRVYRRDYQLLEDFSHDFAQPAHVFAADPDNDGLAELYAASDRSIYHWSSIGAVGQWAQLPSGGKVIGVPTIADVNGDQYPDIVVASTDSAVLAYDRNAALTVNIDTNAATLSSAVTVADVDMDQQGELLVATQAGDVLAYEQTGARVRDWDVSQVTQESVFVPGVVADDRYVGLLSTQTGRDQRVFYRTKSRRFAQLLLGEQVHEWDEKANFDFIETIQISDVLSFPKPFTPNDDGVNDTTTIHYTLSHDAVVTIDLHDTQDRFLTTLRIAEPEKAGARSFIWNGRDTRGTVTTNDDRTLETGLYYVHIRAESDEGFVTRVKTSVIVNGVRASIDVPEDLDRNDAVYPTVFGQTVIRGVAIDPNFGESQLDADYRSYKLYYQPGIWAPSEVDVLVAGAAQSSWLPLLVPQRHQCADNAQNEANDAAYPSSNVSCRPVQHGVLGYFDTTALPNGEYTLLLKVLDSNGNVANKVSYDSLVVRVANPSSDGVFDPDDPLDPANPSNPKFTGPSLSDVSLSQHSLNQTQTATTLRYRLSGETSHVHVEVLPVGGGSVAAFYSFNNVAGNGALRDFVWDGTNNLGRRLPGGTYTIKIVADAIDGTGFAEDASQMVTLAKGFASSDVLNFAENAEAGTSGFRVVPSAFDPLQIGQEGAPAKAYLDYQLTKYANVTAQVLEPLDDGSFALRKTLFTDRVSQSEQANDYWDGTGDNGLILPVGKEYVIRLTATSIDPGNEAQLVQDATVTLTKGQYNDGLAAKISKLVGADGQKVKASDPLSVLQGSSDVVWSATATGRVEMPFSYEISASGEETYGEPQVSYEASEDVYVCQTTGITSGITNSGKLFECVDECESKLPIVSSDDAQLDVTVPAGSTIYSIDVLSNDVAAKVLSTNFSGGSVTIVSDGSYSWDFPSGLQIEGTKLSLTADGVVENGWDGNPDLESCVETNVLCGQQEPIEVNCPHSSNGALFCAHAQLFKCGSLTISALVGGGEGQRSWGGSGVAYSTSGNQTIMSQGTNPLQQFASYNGSVGSGLADTKEAWITDYQLNISNSINGQTSTASSAGEKVSLPGLEAWLSQGELSARVAHNGSLLSQYQMANHDPFFKQLSGATQFDGDEGFTRITDPQYFYHDGYAKQLPNLNPGTELYSFSDRVHLEQWQLDVRYPNVSIDNPKGDNVLDSGAGALDIFTIEDLEVHASGTQGTTNNNVDDYFRLRLLPTAAPKRFVEIHGSAGSNYELFYYDANAADPQWHAIPARTVNAVSNGVLAHWDVTRLNGERYTLVVRTMQGGGAKIDTFDIGIGHEVTTVGLSDGEFVRVSTPYHRASLLFGANSIPDDTLVTITPLDGAEADYALPSGITPVGPIFDIKPDDAEVNFAHHVQLEMVFTPNELSEAFGVADASELTIYNLADDAVLEGLVTVATFDDGNDSDPSNDVWRFTANMEHFSQYILAKPEAAHIVVLYPTPDVILQGSVPLVVRAESQPRPKDDKLSEQPLAALTQLSITAFPKDAPADVVTIHEASSATASTDIASYFDMMDVSGLTGRYVLRIDAEDAQGRSTRFERELVIDNTAVQSTLLVNGKAVANNTTIDVAAGAILELKAVAETLDPWESAAAGLAYAWDDEAYATYTQPIVLDASKQERTLRYRAVDQASNIEDEQHVVLRLATMQANAATAPNGVTLHTVGPAVQVAPKLWVGDDTQLSLTSDLPDADIMVRTHGAGSQLYTGAFDYLDAAEGLYDLDYYHIDHFGLRSAVVTQKVIVDRTAPLSQVAAQGLHSRTDATWYVAPETQFVVTAQDQGEIPVGLAHSEYRWNDEAWQTVSAPLTVPASGVLAVRSVDRLGNVETAQQFDVTIDDQAPTVQMLDVPQYLSPNGDGRHDTLELRVQVADNLYDALMLEGTLTAQDTGELVLEFAQELERGENLIIWDGLNDGSVLPDGRYDVHMQVLDPGDNATLAYEGLLIYDLTPPVTTIHNGVVRAFSPNDDAYEDVLQVDYSVQDNLFTQDIHTTLRINANADHVLHDSTQVVTDTAAPQMISWNGTNALNNGVFDGNYAFALIAEDPAGNRSTPMTGEAEDAGVIFVDRIAPQSSLSVTGPHYDADDHLWLGLGAQVRLHATDPTPSAGLEFLQYRIGSAAWNTYAQPLHTDMFGGDADLQFMSRDNVGNTEATHEVDIAVDTHAPQSQLTIAGPTETIAQQQFVSPETEFTLEADDALGVGIAAQYFHLAQLDEPSQYTEAIRLEGLPDGEYTLRYWAEDWVDNSEAVHERTVTLDGTAPQSRMVLQGVSYRAPDSEVTLLRPDTRIDCQASAERNDVHAVWMRVDGSDWQAAAPMVLPQAGSYTLECKSEDRLGNQEEIQQYALEVDDSAPELTMNIEAPQAGERHPILPQTPLRLQAESQGAPVDYIEYRIGEGAYQRYEGEFNLSGFAPGSYQVTYRVADVLGNVSLEQQIALDLQDITMERSVETMPRILVFMLQTHDLRASDARPNQRLLELVHDDIGGRMTIVTGDHNDPGTLDRFMREMRSDLYDTYVLATDALVVDFFESTRIDRFLQELRLRVAKGDSLLLLTGHAQVRGAAWFAFLAPLHVVDRDDAAAFGSFEEQVGIVAQAFGAGAIADVGANLGALIPEHESSYEELRAGTAALLGRLAGVDAQPNLYEVQDYSVALRNHSTDSVDMTHEERGGLGWFIVDDQELHEHPQVSQAFAAEEIHAQSFMYRFAPADDLQSFVSSVTASWSYGLEQSVEASVSMPALRDAVAMLSDLLGPDATVAMSAEVRELLVQLQRRLLLGSAQITDVQENIDILLSAAALVDAVQDRELLVALGEILEQMSAAHYAQNIDASIAASSATDEDALHGDTVSFIGHGSGGCSLLFSEEP